MWSRDKRIFWRGAVALCFLFAISTNLANAQDPSAATDRLKRTYILSIGDQVIVQASEAEEIGNKPYQIDGEGYLNLPLVGRIRAAGLSVEAFEAELVKALKNYIKNPQAIVTIVQFRTDPIFLLGAFHKPGIYALQGTKTLIELLTSNGGLAPNASRRIRVTRRKEFGDIPLPNATQSSDQKTMSVEISMGDRGQNVNPAEDIVLKPYDVIFVDRAEMIYVNGEVGKVGSIELADRESISITQLISIVGGLTREADPEKARVLRPVLDTNRRAEIPLNLKRILQGDAGDFPLLPNDILYIPRNSKRAMWRNIGYFAIPLAPTLIYLVVR